MSHILDLLGAVAPWLSMGILLAAVAAEYARRE